MSTAVKIGVGCLVVAVLGVLVAAGGGWYWWKNYGEGLIEAAQQTGEEGQTFGRGADDWKCVNETLDRYRREMGIGGAIKSRIFLKSCLQTSTAAPDFCRDVPARTSISRSGPWQKERCEQAGLSDQYCPQLFEEVQEYCSDGVRDKQPPAPPAGDEAPATPAPTRPTRRRPAN